MKNKCSQCTCLQSEVTVANVLVGDGYCNDETNNPNCSFDGGDCCGPCINNEFCSECQCHLGNLSECNNHLGKRFSQCQKPNSNHSLRVVVLNSGHLPLFSDSFYLSFDLPLSDQSIRV